MKKKPQLLKKTNEFILGCTKDFRFADIAGDPGVAGAAGFSEKAVLDILETNGMVFSRDFNVFRPRHLFFRGARFIVSPTEEEAKNRFLIPGHRFVPFCSPWIAPWDCRLVSAGQEVPRKITRRTVASLMVYYTLLGQENIPMLLVADQASNEELMAESDVAEKKEDGVIPFPSAVSGRSALETAAFSLTVFDFTALFKQWGFGFGDGMLLEVEDWMSGVFTVEYLPQKRRRELMMGSAEWIAKLEKGFLKTFDDLGVDFPPEEQIAYAYYYAGHQILGNPPLHLGGFIDSSAEVNIVSVGLETRLWRENRVTAEALGIGSGTPRGATGSLDAILKDLNTALTETEIEAYIRDEFFRRKDDPDAALERILRDRPLPFFSDSQMNDFVRYFRKLWNRIKKNYNYFSDQIPGKARARVLGIFEQHYLWLRNLAAYDIREEDIPLQEITGLTQGIEFLVQTLSLLNSKTAYKEEEIREILELLPQIEGLIEDLHAGILEKLDSLPSEPREKPRNLYLVKGGGAPEGKAGCAYVFRVSLLYITPQIWRSFQVPGSFTLGDLHDVIQVVMGWENYHLHSFEIGGAVYGPVGDDMAGFGMEQLDEEEYTLDSLGLKEKQKLQYTYDFGDDWLHQLTVTKVLPASGPDAENSRLPRCLGGKRACPPEDCGGIPGYADILDALKQPNKRKNREILDWLGGYDPEAFDMDAVNGIFQKKV